MGNVKITDEQLRRCLKAGMKQREIAEKYGMSPGSITNRVKKLWSGKETKSLSVDDVWQDLVHGMEIRATAAKYQVTIPTIYNYIRTKGGMEELQRQRAAHEEQRPVEPTEEPFKTYGQKKAEEIKEQTRINPNNALQEMLEREKAKTSELSQKVKEMEKENAMLRSEQALWIPIKVALPPEMPEGTPDEDCPEYIVTIAGAIDSTILKYSPDGTWFDDNGFVYKVTAWQPLPESYKEVADD